MRASCNARSYREETPGKLLLLTHSEGKNVRYSMGGWEEKLHCEEDTIGRRTNGVPINAEVDVKAMLHG